MVHGQHGQTQQAVAQSQLRVVLQESVKLWEVVTVVLTHHGQTQQVVLRLMEQATVVEA